MTKPVIMFRTRLLLVGLLLVGLISLMGAFAYWASGQFHHQLVRSQLAHGVRAEYLRLAAQLNPLFNRMLYPAFGEEGDLEGRRKELESILDRIRGLVAREVLHTGNEEKDDEELAMLARIERLVAAILSKMEQANQLMAAGRTTEARALMEAIRDDDIHRHFERLINAALERENREVILADQASLSVLRALDNVAAASLLSAILLGLGALLRLRRRLSEPLESLMEGTRKVAGGDLAYRMPVSGHDEFAGIAANFNSMAEELERNREAADQTQLHLEQRVRERTEQLRDANEALAMVDRARREFFADISHELRTPLTVIRGESQFALRGGDKPVSVYREALQRVLEQSDHLARLVDDLLYIARSDSGEVRLQCTAVSLNSLLASACTDAETLSRPQGHAIHFRDEGREVVVSGDQSRLRLLFMILLDNAVRYSQPGGDIDVRLNTAPGGAAVYVSDHGIGISPEELGMVFQRFYRGNQATAINREGLGLGLPMAKAIVTAHGGDITVTSQVNLGTVITVTLPAADKLRIAA